MKILCTTIQAMRLIMKFEDAENSTELFKTRDMMKVFLELSSSAKNSDDAMYKIIRYVAEKFDIDWFQIMKVNTKEDLITISYEWCSDPKFQNNAGKRGYYAHSDIEHFKEFFEKYPVFILSNEKNKRIFVKVST